MEQRKDGSNGHGQQKTQFSYCGRYACPGLPACFACLLPGTGEFSILWIT
ncbi:uncharacterized protein METZ01_LOCUS287022 [marine metagenome]|uniref:Uncharacterized protein n=1 Tax=marine metagenome TaxID=408172 RepID=A0A382LBF3_9ZZZZ